MSEKLQRWLSPPDPSTNHDMACNTQLDGSAKWFIEGTTFREWKEKKIGSLLWISGNRTLFLRSTFMAINPLSDYIAGCGKTILWCAVFPLSI